MSESTPPTTTDGGAPVASDEHSLTVGPDGPILLQDHYLIEQMANFNRERIPERQPHAKGGGAFGHVRGDQRRQRVHQGRGLPARHQDRDGGPVLHRGRRARQPRHLARPARLRAEVLHHRGQLRHGRQQHAGVLRARPDEVPALHPLARSGCADNNLRDHDMQWDFWTLSPESAHQVTWLMGDRGIPEDLAAHERLLQPHLHVGQRRRRAVLGEVPLQDRPGHRLPHPGGGRPAGRRGRRLPPARPVRRDRGRRLPELDAARCRSCRSRRPRPTGSTRST